MKQFRDSRYWVKEDGTVLKFYPAKKYSSGGSIINGKDYGVDRWKEMKPTLRKNGYLVFNLQCPSVTDKGYFNTSVHRMVAECYIGEIPEGYVADHIDGNKVNNHLSNLQIISAEENINKNPKNWKGEYISQYDHKAYMKEYMKEYNKKLKSSSTL